MTVAVRPLISLLAIASLGVGGCGSPRTTTSAPTVRATTPPAFTTVPGTWSGEWQSDGFPETTGSFDATIVLAGRTLSGSIRVTGSSCVTNVTISGSLIGDAIRFGVSNRPARFTYRGEVAGGLMSGRYSSCEGRGSWTALKVGN